jgi:DNA-binding LytR/AlgR family response regulator
MSVALRAVIADDEPLSLRRLELGLSRLPGLEIVGSAQNAEDARTLIKSLQPNLALLDIKMPGATGLDLAAELAGVDAPEVIFVTAYAQHAVKAFDLAAVDFLLKPLDFDRLAEAVGRARERIMARRRSTLLAEVNAELEALREGDHGSTYERDLWIIDGRGRVRVPLDEVVWFEAEREYVRIHATHRSYFVRCALQALADRLDPGQFLRLHRSALVNGGKIIRLVRRKSGGSAAVLATGVEIPIGRKHQNAVRRHLGI